VRRARRILLIENSLQLLTTIAASSLYPADSGEPADAKGDKTKARRPLGAVDD